MTDRVVRYQLRGEITDFQAKMSAAGASVGKLGNDLTKLDAKGAKMRDGLSAVGGTARNVGLAAAAGLGAIIAVTAKFDAAMSNVQAATGESAGAMDKLREAAIQAGEDTAFSATEAAAGVENLAKAGVSTADILAGGLAGALDLAAAGEMAVADAAEVAATAMTQFKLSGDQVPHVADLLAAAAGKAQGEVADMGAALAQGGLVASQMGLSLEETTGSLAAFAAAGLLGSDAGTSLKTMLLRLSNPSAEAARTMESLGIAAYDTQGNFVGMESLSGQLAGAFEGQTQAQRDAAMATIFGSDAIRAASILYSQGAEGIAEWTAKVDDSGFAAEQAAARLDNLKGDIEGLLGSMETALIKSGESSQGALRGMVQWTEGVVDAYNDLSPAAQGATTGILGVTAVAGGSVWALSKLVQGVAGTKLALSQLGATAAGTKAKLAGVQAFAAGPWGIGLAVAGVAAYALSTVNDELTASLEGTADALAEGTMSLDDQAAALEVARQGVADYRAALDDVNLWDPAVFKNEIEGWFGKNDIEEAEQALAEIEEQFQANLDAVQANDRALGHLSGVVDKNRDGFITSADAIMENVEAMQNLRSETLRGLNASLNYQAALDDSRAALKENGRTVDESTAKGRANLTALYGQAAAFNDLNSEAKNAPGAHRAAIASFVNMATQMGMGRKEARDLAREILEIPDRRITVTANTSQALSAIGSTRAALDALRDKRVIVTTEQHTINRSPVAIARAAGGPLPSPLPARGPYLTKENAA